MKVLMFTVMIFPYTLTSTFRRTTVEPDDDLYRDKVQNNNKKSKQDDNMTCKRRSSFHNMKPICMILKVVVENETSYVSVFLFV